MMESSWRILTVLAQVEDREGKVADLHFWLIVVIAFGAVAGTIGYMVIKKVRASQDVESEEAPFSLAELRRIYEAGEVSLEEYEHMRASMIAKVKAALGDEEIRVETAPPRRSGSPATRAGTSEKPDTAMEHADDTDMFEEIDPDSDNDNEMDSDNTHDSDSEWDNDNHPAKDDDTDDSDDRVP